jgi:hypothetical protein
VGVGIGDQNIWIQLRQQPVHGRVGREAGFQSVDMGCQILETLLDIIKPGFRAEKGKPGCPHMGGNKKRPITGFQNDLQQVLESSPRIGLPSERMLPICSSFLLSF